MFRRARLYVGPHGAGLSNLVFMPLNSTVLEIRPRGRDKGCYRLLSLACGINYYLSLGEGGMHSALNASIKDIEWKVQHIKAVFDQEDRLAGN